MAKKRREPLARRAGSWILAFVLLGILLLHFFGSMGRAIKETTPYIDYGQIVSVHDYWRGLHHITANALADRLSYSLIARLVFVFAVFAVARTFISQIKRRWIILAAVGVILIQLPFCDMPLLGLGLLWRSGNLSKGIDGELFAEDWFSLAASDLLLIATIAFGIYVVVKRDMKGSSDLQ